MRSLKSLSDKELTGRLRQLVREEQNLTLLILSHIAEVGRRELYLEKAYRTLTEYCIHELGYGESSAWRRVRAARVIKDIPEVYDLMKSKKLSFSAVLQIANVLDAGNKNTLLPRVVGKSKHQLGEISLHSEGKFHPTVKKSTPEIEIVLEKMFEIRFAADEELMEPIRWMKSHLSHKYAKGASYLEIFKYAIKYLKEREDLALQEKARKSSARTDTRYIPRNVKQRVWKRDKGRCTFFGNNGKRCNSDYLLQFDHYPVPYAKGGPSTANNLRLLCTKHNKHTAEKTYGKSHVEKFYLKEELAGISRGNRRGEVIPNMITIEARLSVDLF
jgi:hypothetical protein